MKELCLLLAGLMGLVLAGCEQSTTIGDCGGEVVSDAAAPFGLTPLNQPCTEHDECAHDECVPVVDAPPGHAGVCWNDTFHGCEIVDFPSWVVDGFCGARLLSVCQTELTPEMEARCDPPTDSLAPWIANFMCCDP